MTASIETRILKYLKCRAMKENTVWLPSERGLYSEEYSGDALPALVSVVTYIVSFKLTTGSWGGQLV